MDIVQWDDIYGRMIGVLTNLDHCFTRHDSELLHEFIDANELGLALEQMAELLAQDSAPITDQERADLLALNEAMSMGERVPRALMRCPSAQSDKR